MTVSQSYSSDTATAAAPCEAEGSAWVSTRQAAYRQVPESWRKMQELQLNPSHVLQCALHRYIKSGPVLYQVTEDHITLKYLRRCQLP